jgi:hypothetical protein
MSIPAEALPNDIKDSRVDLSFREGHDADTNTEETHHETKEPVTTTASRDSERDTEKELPVDMEKGLGASGPDSEAGKELTEGAEAEEAEDPNVIFWDGPNDPENPQNWTRNKKLFNIGILSMLSLITPLGSSMFAPGVPQVMQEFHNFSPELATFVVSVYILGFAFGPLVVAPLSEIYGRTPVYHTSNVLFLVFTIGAAESKSMGMLIAFRLLQGLAGSTPITIGSGTIADMYAVEARGRAMATWAMGPYVFFDFFTLVYFISLTFSRPDCWDLSLAQWAADSLRKQKDGDGSSGSL